MANIPGELRCSRWRLLVMVVILFLWSWITTGSRAQGPQFNVDQPPGSSEGGSTLGPALGQAGFVEEGSPVSPRPFSGRAGPGGSRAPVAGVTVPINADVSSADRTTLPDILCPAGFGTDLR